MNNLHLANGSILPILQNGILRFYNMRFCPYAERTLLILHAKNIKHELINVNLKSKPDWFLKRNPFGKVPMLEQNEKILYESLATCDYLDEVYPSPPMYPADPWSKAVDKSLIGILNEKFVATMSRSLYRSNNPSLINSAIEELKNGYKVIEEELSQRDTAFLGGNKPGMVDYMIWPWLERIPALKCMIGDEFYLQFQDSFPLSIQYIKNLGEDPTVSAVQLPTEQHVEFLRSYLNGNPHYDIGLTGTSGDDAKL